jgi:uncharacterized protein
LPGYFFDTSALVKLYHFEVGTPAIDRIASVAETAVRTSRLAAAELISAFAIKVRTKLIDRGDADQFLRQFREDTVAGRLEIFSVSESDFEMAEGLIERYAFDKRLRTLDALQLAVALELRSQNLIDHFVAADQILCEVAGLEGFSVINPERS